MRTLPRITQSAIAIGAIVLALWAAIFPIYWSIMNCL